MCGLSLVGVSGVGVRAERVTLHCDARASHWGGFSFCGGQALGTGASVVAARGPGSCSSWALESMFSSCGTQA